jgi:hypothetical protein
MSHGLGRRQRDILEQLHLAGDWLNIGELAGETDDEYAARSDVESVRRAVRTLEAAGLIETRMQGWRELGAEWGGCGHRQRAARLLCPTVDASPLSGRLPEV